MRTIGIDLAAGARGTAVVVMDWEGGELQGEAKGTKEDSEICDLITQSKDEMAVVGIDVPLGWPLEFVQAVRSHHGKSPQWPKWLLEAGEEGQTPNLREEARRDARAVLQFRPTDWAVRAFAAPATAEVEVQDAGESLAAIAENLGPFPLSVSANLLGVTAMRGVGLLRRLHRAFGRRPTEPIPRDGRAPKEDGVVEAYPAVALRRWLGPRMSDGSYKRGKNASRNRGKIVDALRDDVPYLGVALLNAARASHDVLDALVCALIARAAALGDTFGPRDVLEDNSDAAAVKWQLQQRAKFPGIPWDSQVATERTAMEGWIHVPTRGLNELA